MITLLIGAEDRNKQFEQEVAERAERWFTTVTIILILYFLCSLLLDGFGKGKEH